MFRARNIFGRSEFSRAGAGGAIRMVNSHPAHRPLAAGCGDEWLGQTPLPAESAGAREASGRYDLRALRGRLERAVGCAGANPRHAAGAWGDKVARIALRGFTPSRRSMVRIPAPGP